MENSLLLPPVGVWAVLSPSQADHPLRPANDRSLGKPLPHQQTNHTQAAPKAPEGFNPKTICGISPPFGGLFLTLGYVPTRYSAVRRSCILTLYSNYLSPPNSSQNCIWDGRLSLRFVKRTALSGVHSFSFEQTVRTLPLDLHVLGTPPAFILSQDQTLHKRELILFLTVFEKTYETQFNELTLIVLSAGRNYGKSR